MEVYVLLGFVLILSIYLGLELISKVPSTLHTPLMSGANAISGIALVGLHYQWTLIFKLSLLLQPSFLQPSMFLVVILLLIEC